MGQLLLTCLGNLEVLLDGEPLTAFQTDKVRALLVYLAVEGAPQSRSWLAQFLWPGYSEESANNSLRQSLHRLRHLLRDGAADPPWLLITRQTLQFNPAAAIDVDAVRFTKLIAECTAHVHDQLVTCQPCLARLQEAVNLYQGDFLSGFTVADSDPFEEWRRILQEQFHLQVLSTLTNLGNAAELRGDDEGAHQAAQRQLRLEPWLEAAHRRLMRVLAQRGQWADALAQYQRCRQVLAEELQLEPDAETHALYEQIRSDALTDTTRNSPRRTPVVQAESSVPAPAPAAPPRLFLAGRSHEFAHLERWLAEATAGKGRLGFVVGEAGSGKTTLLRAFIERVQASHPRLRIASGGCDEYIGSGLPFLPWRTLLQELTASDDAAWLPIPSLAKAARFLSTSEVEEEAEPRSQLTQDQLFTEIGARVSALAAQQPLLLILEDLHWADLSSLYLLLYLSQRIERSPLLLLCTFRPEELAAGEHGQHPLLRLISESKRRFGQVLIDLSALPQAARQQFIADWLDQEPNQLGIDFRQALLRHTEGHALFTIELLQELRVRGDLQRNAAGEWVAQQSLQWQALPARVEGVIESQVARLPHHLRQVLRIAAIEGEDFTAEVVSKVAAIPLAQVALWLSDELDRRYRIIDVQRAQSIGQQRLSFYRFRHHLFQQYLYHSLNQVEQATYHAQVGQILEEYYGEHASEIALQLARHFEQAGLSEKAIDYYRLAGEKARDLSANTEAITHLQTALLLLQEAPALPQRSERELSIQLLLGHALVTVHGYAAEEVGRAFHRAHTLYQQVRAFPQSSPTVSAQPYGTLLHGLHRFYYMRGDWPAARQIGEQLLELAQQSQEPVLQAEAQRALGMALWHQGAFTTAQQHFEQGIAAYEPNLHARYLQLSGQDPGMICTAYTAWGMWMLGYPTQAAERLERCLALAQTFEHPFTLIYALQYAAVLHQFRRDAAATLAQADAIIALAQQHGFTYYLGWGAMLRGWAQVYQGEEATGIAELQEGLASWQATGATLAQHYYYGLLADAYLTLGQPEAGLSAVADGLATIPSSGQFWEAELYRLQGELLLRQSASQEGQAEAAFQQALTIARRQEAKLLALRAVYSLSDLWQRQGKATDAYQWLQSSYDGFSEGFDTVDLKAAQTRLTAFSRVAERATQAVALGDRYRATTEPGGAAPSLLPPLRRPHNLPTQLTPLIGRTQEVAELTERLQQPDVRLLTIVGIGGMGKTRLAIEVGHSAQATFADGVCFVGLATLSTPAALAAAIATALGMPLQGGEPHNLLIEALRQQQMLLILDNFEHLLGEAAAVDLVVDLLVTAPAIQILVTSRERLRLRYEQIYTVQPLAFTAEATLTTATTMAAVRLFVQTSQRIQANFQLTEENLPSVLRICRLVQGMPLGLELAAANIDQLTLDAIADTIAHNAEFLAVDWRDLPARQQSMRAVFLWSWRLLDEQERQVFRQLAIFQGGITQSAAKAIAGATQPLLTRLLHKSLLQGSTPIQADGRYLIHGLLRQFAAAELTATAEAETTANRHSTYYLSLLATQQSGIMRNAVRTGVQAIQDEIDNIRQAWRWGAGHLPAALVEPSALALREFYWLTGLTAEAIEMFTLATQARATYLHQSAAGRPIDQPDEVRLYSILVGATAGFQLTVGRHEEALASATEILHLAPAEHNPVGAAFGYMLKGQALRRQGKSVEGQQCLEQSVRLARQARATTANPALLLDIEKRAYSWLASIALSNDDYATVRAHGIHQLEICQQFQMQVGEVIALTCLVDVDKALGDYLHAQQYAEQALATAHQVNFRWGQAICFEQMAELAWRQGDYQQAQKLYEQALALFRSMNRILEESNVAQMLGRLCLWLGDIIRAQQWIEQAFQLLQSLGAPARESCWVLASRARLHYSTDNLAAALVDAEAAWTMARQLDGGASQADALVLLGLVQERLQQTTAAAAAYQEAVQLYTALGHRHHTAEPRAGLARLALAGSEPMQALAMIEEVLSVLHDHPLAGFDEPFQVYLTCYKVLAAHQDPRATPLLTAAHELLTAYAERLLDPSVRRLFLENVASHRDLQAAYAAAQASADQGTGNRVTAQAIPHNLPAILTHLIGRERELAEISARLYQAETRLVTIVGAGGMGKTRLALAVAHALLELRMTHNEESEQEATSIMRHAEFATHAYPDGIFFVSLAPLTTDAALVSAIAAALGLEIQGDPQSALQHFLHKKRLLLILDNFEHLLAGAPFVTTLLQGAPNLQILITSRERLNVRGEQLYPLAGLAYEGEQLSAASQLFVQRAQQIHPGFVLQAPQQRAVQQISQLVQGMPLALEMAAAWTGDLAIDEIAQEIAQSADFLTVDWPDVPARQRSMRAVFQWSWRLLTTAEQQLLCRLAIFNGSFTRTASEAITGASVRMLTNLLHKSLIHYARTPEGPSSEQTDATALPSRYELHPLTRQFTAEQSMAIEEQSALITRFSTFYLDFLAEREAALLGSAVSETVAEIQREFDHVRQAWRWAITHELWAALARSAYCLSEFLAIVGRTAESEQFFMLAIVAYTEQKAGVTQTAPDPLSKLWALVAVARVRQGKATTVEAAQQAITLGEADGVLEAQILGHYVCGLTAVNQSHYTEAQSCYEKVRLLFEEVHRQGSATLLLRDFEWRYYLSLFGYASQQGQLAEAQSYSSAGLAVAQRLGSLRGQITLRMSLVDLYLEQGEFAHAQAELAFIQPVVQRMRWRWGECGAYYITSFICCFFGNYREALTAGQMALTIVQEIGEAGLESMIILQLAYLYALVGDHQRAWTMLPLQTPQEQQDAPPHIRYTLLMIATLTSWRSGETIAADTTATQAWTAATAFNNRFAQACALIYRGHIRTDLQEWAAADADYQAALHIYTTLNAADKSMEAQAGLAQLALRQGDVGAAQRWVEAILPLLAAEPYVVTTPYLTYQICYEVLAANHDSRAATVLQQGHDRLQATAATLDVETRLRFLEAIPTHRKLIATYQEWQARAGATRR